MYIEFTILIIADLLYSGGEIAVKFDIAKTSISRHLDVLRKAEIVTSIRKGNQIIIR